MITAINDTFSYGSELVKELRKILKHLPNIDNTDNWKVSIICLEDGKLDLISFRDPQNPDFHIDCDCYQIVLKESSTIVRILYKYDGWNDIYEIPNATITCRSIDDPGFYQTPYAVTPVSSMEQLPIKSEAESYGEKLKNSKEEKGIRALAPMGDMMKYGRI